MRYVKEFEVGNIRLDTPNKHIVHELPLLAFGDARDTLALSLIFQSKLTNNPFYIANGYKLSLQKRIIFSGGYPHSYEDGHGTLTKLNRFYNKYAFDDGSHRFIRLINGQYVLENPDYSTEVFNGSGNILLVKDKYGNTILSYTYSSGKLISVVYKGAKTISLGYSDGALQYIQYIYSGNTYTTTFTYSGDEVIVNHYSGVDYHLTYTSRKFEVYSANAGEAFSNDLSYKDSVIASGNVITIEKYRGNKKLDSVMYDFVNCDSTGKANILDITDFHNVTTRVQFMKEKPAYSYEMLDTMFIDNPTTHDQYYPGSVTFYNNEQASGFQGYGDGVAMVCETDTHFTGFNRYAASHSFSGMMTVSGWLKPIVDATESIIRIHSSDSEYVPYKITGLVKDVWTYFSISFYMEDNTFIRAITSETDANILACDFRLMGQDASTTDEDEYKDNLTKASDVLIHTDSNGKDTPIPITDTVEYINGTSPINKTDYPMTIKDLMRFKINQAIGTNKGEIYYNDGRGILSLNGAFLIRYHAPEGTVISALLNNLAIGKMHTSEGNVYLTKTNFTFENGITRLKTQSLRNACALKSEVYDDALDLIESTVEGVTTKYVRNATTGLVEKQTITDARNTGEITCSAAYDTNDFLVSTTDEFGVVTTYTTDATWGVVTKSAVSNGLTVTDTFDDDCSTQESRSFGNGTTKRHEFTYFPSGLLGTIRNDTLNYTMGYSDGMLSSVEKNNRLMEQRYISDDRKTVTTYYPGFLGPQYSITQRYDDYGRLTKIDGVLTNTYDVNPTHAFTLDSDGVVHSNFTVEGKDNRNGKLATSTDHITGNTTKYGYKNNKLSFIAEFDSEGNQLAMESISYDTFNRPYKKIHSFDPAGVKSVSSVVSYTSDDVESYEGDTVKSCTYKVNEDQKAHTINGFDSFKRLYMKETKLNQNIFVKKFTYDKGRISGISDTVLNMKLGTNGYKYDSMGRITDNTYSSKNTKSNYRTYRYDQYGQLIRENNEGIDKTFIYTYNHIGNIVSVKEYDFTLSETPSGTCTEKVYTYDSTYPDRLTNFNGSGISYDSMGYPVSDESGNYVWNKGKLFRVYKGAAQQSGSLYEDCVFTYDAYGRRLSKDYTYDPNPTSTSDYSYTYKTTYNYDNSGRLIREYCTEKYISGATVTKEFIYLYDESSVIGVLYSLNGAAQLYYYHRNLQGDVVAIYDTSGNVKAEYNYDAWGNCTIAYSAGTDLAESNPIRYRGYYYDRETGLYYCNARYYSPKWRRFISPDDTAYLDPETVNGLNLYCYCGNDPVNYADPSGYFAIAAFLISIGVSLLFEVIDDGMDGALFEGSHDWKDYLGAGIAGALGGLGGGIAAQAFCALVGGFADAALSGDLASEGLWSTLDSILFSSVISFGIGAAANRLAAGIKASSLKKLTNNVANRKLKAMGATIKIGSHAAKAKGGLSRAIREQSKWIGNVIYGDLLSAISGGIASIVYGHIMDGLWWPYKTDGRIIV